MLGLWMVMDEVFNGPSETARNRLTMSLLEASATKWVPAVFVGEETVEEIRAKVASDLPDEQSDPSQVIIRTEDVLNSDEWADYPDALPTKLAAELIGCAPQRVGDWMRKGVISSVSVGGMRYCGKAEFIAYCASPEMLRKPGVEKYRELIAEFLCMTS